MRPLARIAALAPAAAFAVALAVAVGSAACTDFGSLTSQWEAGVADGAVDAATDGPAADLTSTCSSGVRDGDETGVDCGGSCPPCELGQGCNFGRDCVTGACSAGACALASGPPSWLTLPPLPATRQQGAAAAAADGRVYAIGGYVANLASGSTEGFVGNSWTAGPPLFGALILHTAAPQLGKIVVAGGYAGGPQYAVVILSAGSWAFGPNLGQARFALAAANAPDGKVYVVGGHDGANTSGVLELLVPGAVAWQSLPSMPTHRHGLAAAVGADGKLYAFGGYVPGAPSTVAEGYDPQTTIWTASAPMPRPRAWHGAAAAPDGRIYVVGGADATHVLADVDTYTPATHAWTPAAPLANARQQLAVALAPDGRVFAMGGGNLLGGVAVVEAYGPAAALNPVSGTAGTQVAVMGANFAAGATVSVLLGSLATAVVATGNSDGAGSLVAPIVFTIPPGTPAGPLAVYAVDDRARYPIKLTFQVTP
jgi:Kelch motif